MDDSIENIMFYRTRKALIGLINLMKCSECENSKMNSVSVCCKHYFCSECVRKVVCRECGAELMVVEEVKMVYERCAKMEQKIARLRGIKDGENVVIDGSENILYKENINTVSSNIINKAAFKMDERGNIEKVNCEIEYSGDDLVDSNVKLSEDDIVCKINKKPKSKEDKQKVKNNKKGMTTNTLLNQPSEMKMNDMIDEKKKGRRKRVDYSHFLPEAKKIKTSGDDDDVGNKVGSVDDDTMMLGGENGEQEVGCAEKYEVKVRDGLKNDDEEENDEIEGYGLKVKNNGYGVIEVCDLTSKIDVSGFSLNGGKRNKGDIGKIDECFDDNQIKNNTSTDSFIKKQKRGSNKKLNFGGEKRKDGEAKENEKMKLAGVEREENKINKIEIKDKIVEDKNYLNINVKSRANKNKNTEKKMKKNRKGETELHLACIKGDADKVKLLLKEGHDINVRDNANWTPLHEACHHGHVDIVSILLNTNNCNVDQPGCDNYTAAHDAVEQDQLECVKLLIDKGADLNQRNVRGETCFNLATSKQMLDLLKHHPISLFSSFHTSPISTNHQSERFSTPKIQKVSGNNLLANQSIIVTCSGFDEPMKEWISRSVERLNWVMEDEFTEQVTHVICRTDVNNICTRTFKYLCALMLGKWVVNVKWLEACDEKTGWMEEDLYEVVTCSKDINKNINNNNQNNTLKNNKSIEETLTSETHSGDSINKQINNNNNNIIIYPGSYQSYYSVPFKARNNEHLQLPRLFDGCNFFVSQSLYHSNNNKNKNRNNQKLRSELQQLIKLGSGRLLSREPKAKMIRMDANNNNNNKEDNNNIYEDDVVFDPNTSLLNKSFRRSVDSNLATGMSLATVATVPHHASNNSKFSQCSYFVVTSNIDRYKNGKDVDDYDDEEVSSDTSKSNNEDTTNDLKHERKYRMLNRKLFHVTPSWLFDCVCKFAIVE